MEQHTTPTERWVVAHTAWDAFVDRHPELGLSGGRAAFHNFLRRHRLAMVEADALRRANGKHWIALDSRFEVAAFDLLTRTDLAEVRA